MTCTPPCGKRISFLYEHALFSSPSESLTVRLPVENMDHRFTVPRILGTEVTAGIAAALQQHMPAKSILIVCDDATWRAAGAKVYAQIQADASLYVTIHSLGDNPHATLKTAIQLADKAADYDGLLAIGSGTVNDVTKYAAAHAGKPYVVVATAASMNGYSSTNASLEKHGLKQSFPATVPRLVIADTTIIAAAPVRLARAGLGDTLCRSTVEADMLLSHYLLGTPYPRALFDHLRRHENQLIAGAQTASANDPSFVAMLMEALLDAGDAMTAYGSSAVASQGEHMIAHTLEMMNATILPPILHGEMIGLTTLTMNHLQHTMLAKQPIVKSLPHNDAVFIQKFGQKIGIELAESYAKKLLDTEYVTAINARMNDQWPEIRTSLIEIMVAPSIIERAFMQSGLVTDPCELGLNKEHYRVACAHSYLTRDRFTFLDLAAMNDKLVDSMHYSKH